MKILSFLVVIVFCISLCACGSRPASGITEPSSPAGTENITEGAETTNGETAPETYPSFMPEFVLPEDEFEDYPSTTPDVTEASREPVAEETTRFVATGNNQDPIVLPDDELD